MSRRLKRAAIVVVVLFAAAQLIRPERANPTIDPNHSIQANLATSGLAPTLNRSCGDCHSYATDWRWYTQIAPLSWAMAYGVKQGRRAVNFSEWSAYSPQQRQLLLAASCYDAQTGKMPGLYTLVRSETRLSTQEVEGICQASRQSEAKAATDAESQRR